MSAQLLFSSSGTFDDQRLAALIVGKLLRTQRDRSTDQRVPSRQSWSLDHLATLPDGPSRHDWLSMFTYVIVWGSRLDTKTARHPVEPQRHAPEVANDELCDSLLQYQNGASSSF